MSKELVILSGKGGTGKTSLCASFAVLAGRSILADCDVDAPDLHLLLSPRPKERHEFLAGWEVSIREEECTGCGLCSELCRFEAIEPSPGGAFHIVPLLCEGCRVCAHFCPARAIDVTEALCGQWLLSETRCGPMFHAHLEVPAENSGKLVTLLRQKAAALAEELGGLNILVDGPPGIGCPVIASVSGADVLLVVTEPTTSGLHDLERVLKLASHFGVPASVCVNKWDLNPELTEEIEKRTHQRGAEFAGRIRYDPAVTRAQMEQRAIVETDAPSAQDVRYVWEKLITQHDL